MPCLNHKSGLFKLKLDLNAKGRIIMTELMKTTSEKQLSNVYSIMENVIADGDLSKLTSQQRVEYYHKTCESLGLNTLTRPFEYQRFNGKVVLYARKEAT